MAPHHSVAFGAKLTFEVGHSVQAAQCSIPVYLTRYAAAEESFNNGFFGRSRYSTPWRPKDPVPKDSVYPVRASTSTCL